jgi:hypothetical protein
MKLENVSASPSWAARCNSVNVCWTEGAKILSLRGSRGYTGVEVNITDIDAVVEALRHFQAEARR